MAADGGIVAGWYFDCGRFLTRFTKFLEPRITRIIADYFVEKRLFVKINYFKDLDCK